MALTESQMLPLGTQSPDFDLLDVVSNTQKTLSSLQGKQGTLVVFMCNHCPYVVYLLDAIIQKAALWKEKGIATIGISSNSILTHPQDGPEAMRALALEKSFGFPYLYDPNQETAHAFDAACTPDFFLFDSNLKLHYRGRFDAATPGNNTSISGEDLEAAIDQLLKNKTPLAKQMPSMGCNIKWNPGNEPKWWTS